MIWAILQKKLYNFSRYSLPIYFLRDIHRGNLSLEDVDKEQNQFNSELKLIDQVDKANKSKQTKLMKLNKLIDPH